jgi:hypothetical protein
MAHGLFVIVKGHTVRGQKWPELDSGREKTVQGMLGVCDIIRKTKKKEGWPS